MIRANHAIQQFLVYTLLQVDMAFADDTAKGVGIGVGYVQVNLGLALHIVPDIAGVDRFSPTFFGNTHRRGNPNFENFVLLAGCDQV